MKIKTYRSIIDDRSLLTKKIATYWDKTSSGWQKIWGPHIHHGYYENNKLLQDPIAAQEKLIDKLLELLELTVRSKVLDIGCGLGGSSLYLAKKYNADVTGITLSEKQVALASEKAKITNIKNVHFKIEDALSLQSFSDNVFDVVWSLESCEQFYDKQIFLQQAFRVLKPGGKLLLATWCAGHEEYENHQAKQYRKLCLAFDVPYMPTIKHYCGLIADQGFKLNKFYDWTRQVEKSWHVGFKLLHAYNFLQIFKLAGWQGMKIFSQIKLMQNAYREGRITYGVFVGTK